jgi:hypothetical protein
MYALQFSVVQKNNKKNLYEMLISLWSKEEMISSKQDKI